jgi:EmrB/QacA subfamily drug resistance transporter
MAAFMEVLDTSIANVALPYMAGGLGSSNDESTWVLTSYLVSNAIVLPISGWLASLFGRKRFFIVCIFIFTLASVFCGSASGLGMLLLFRVIQGAGGGGLQPMAQAILADTFPPEKRGLAFALYGITAIMAPTIGPTLGGWITDNYSWRWIFFINLPIGALGLWLVLRYIPRHEAGARRPFDLRGFAYTAASLVALIQGLSFIAETQAHRIAGVALVCAGLVAGVLAVRHARRHPTPLLDLAATREPTFVLSTLSAGLLGRIAIQATPFLLPLMFQIGFGDSAFKSGLMVLVYMGGNLVMKVGTTRLLRRFGFRTMVVANGLLAALAIAACALLTPDRSLVFVCVVLVVAGMTRSMQFTTVNTMAFADIPAAARAGATTMAAVSQQVGAALSVAFATLLLAISQSMAGHQQLAAADFQFAFVACAVLLAISALWSLRLPHDAGAEVTSRG